MQKTQINHKKKMAQLRYKDEILKMHSKGVSILQITKQINAKLSRTALKVNLSNTTISKLIKRYQ